MPLKQLDEMIYDSERELEDKKNELDNFVKAMVNALLKYKWLLRFKPILELFIEIQVNSNKEIHSGIR